MSAVLITGMSGAGKSAIAEALARRGIASIDADGDPWLAGSVDDGNVVEDPSVPDFAWLARCSWAWDPARLGKLIRTAAPATLYVCGGAANELELADRFTQVFLLEMDEPTMLARLDAPSRDHEWGRIGDTREHLRRRRPGHQDRLRAFGAIPSTQGSPSTRWWTRYSLARLPAPARATPPPSRAVSRPACHLADLRGGVSASDRKGPHRRVHNRIWRCCIKPVRGTLRKEGAGPK